MFCTVFWNIHMYTQYAKRYSMTAAFFNVLHSMKVCFYVLNSMTVYAGMFHPYAWIIYSIFHKKDSGRDRCILWVRQEFSISPFLFRHMKIKTKIRHNLMFQNKNLEKTNIIKNILKNKHKETVIGMLKRISNFRMIFGTNMKIQSLKVYMICIVHICYVFIYIHLFNVYAYVWVYINHMTLELWRPKLFLLFNTDSM